MDWDDAQRLKALAASYDSGVKTINEAIIDYANCRFAIDCAIATRRVSEKVSWEKQCIELMKIDPDYSELIAKYKTAKVKIETGKLQLKSIEHEINIFKKIYNETPK